VKLTGLLALAALTTMTTASARPQSDDTGPSFGSPDSVVNQLEEDHREKSALAGGRLLSGWFDWKDELTAKRGLSLGLDYSAAYFSADQSPGEDEAASGMGRFFGTWDLIGRDSGNTGSFIWKAEHRHRYTDIPVSDLGFAAGSVTIVEPPFSDQQLRLTNLYWRQRFQKGRISAVGGLLDATDHVDAFALGSPWLHFTNFAFSTGTTTMDLPNDALFGFAGAAMVTDHLYLIGGFGDANSDPTVPFDTVESFFDDNEYFKHLEIGWTTSHERFIFDNVHLTLWQKDERERAGTPEGWGANFSFSRYIDDKWLPFLRAGWADDGAGLMRASVSAGFGYQREPGGHLLGVGLNWGDPNELSFGSGLEDQTLAEVFYRLQIAQQFALTPSVQYIDDPALDPEQASTWVIGARARLAL
jgi:porin